MPNSQPPITVGEAAAQTGIPARTVRDALFRGDLPAHKLPGVTGAWVIRQRDLDKWAAKRDAKRDAKASA